MLHRIVIYFINQINVTIIRLFNPMGNQQEGVSYIRQYIVCYIFARIQINHREIVNSRFISFFLQDCPCVDKCPGTIRIVIQRKFFLLSVLLQDKDAFIYAWFGSFGHCHSFQDILSDLVRAKV